VGDLSELSFQTSYHKGRDDIAERFYLPCMRRAAALDRAVGFFRSTVFIVAWPALKDFVRRNGRIRVLCSQILSAEDIQALRDGYSARVDAALAARFLEEVRSLLKDEVLKEPARVLAALVAAGHIELKIALLSEAETPARAERIFHDKLGIFRDDKGNRVIFKGSMNETWAGLAADGNLESIDVAASWMGARDLERTTTEERYFQELWLNRYPSLSVLEFPDVAANALKEAAEKDWEAALERLLDSSSRHTATEDARGRTLKPHQSAGLASWAANGRRGILAFATGSGKTFTAITAIREAVSARGEVVVVVVPDKVLFEQWYGELLETTKDLAVEILRAGSGYTGWRENLRAWTAPGPLRRLVLATVQTACSEEFRSRLTRGTHVTLVADEVHRLGSPKHREILDDGAFGARLGLSATPERAGDNEGTAAIVAYFRGVLEPRYSLADAVRDGVLTRYFYRPHTVQLTDDEAEEWRELSVEIGQLQGRLASGDTSEGLDLRIKRQLIRRAKVVKHAAGKVPLAVEVLQAEYRRGQRWIVYCDDLAQLGAVSVALESAGLQVMPFHSQIEGDRTAVLRWLDARGGIVVAIKCLDEGVDVPSVSHALILASSKNPREFIQRRGRVLRLAPETNKALAYVHDAIVMPPRVSGTVSARTPDPITAGELARAVEFAQHADNAAAAADLQQIAIEAGIEWRTLIGSGVEADEDE
jgi:superfamily II DNA or RNA helicase